jgi:hypothetical protein
MDVVESFKAHLTKAAGAAGVDIAGLEVSEVLLDDTWGRQYGLHFTGPHAARAAACFDMWKQAMCRRGVTDWSWGEARELAHNGASGVAVPSFYIPGAE